MSTVFITGGNKGIGYALAEEFLKKKYRVVISSRDVDRGLDARRRLSEFGDIEMQMLDLKDFRSIEKAAETMKELFKDLKILVNNAGISGDMHKKAWEYTPQEILEVCQVNFVGAYDLTRRLMPVLEKNRGKIVNITMPTTATENFHPFAYQASKSPFNVMIDNFGFELAKKNSSAQIFGIMPGVVSTDLNNHIQGEFVKTPAAAAKEMIEVIVSKQNLNGQIIDLANDFE